MPDAWKRTGAFEKRTIGGNQWAIELHGECQERGVVKRTVKLLADSRCSLWERRRGRSNDERQGFQIINGLIQAARIEVSF